MKVEIYQKQIHELKQKLVSDINQIITKIIVPGELDYVELPRRIKINSPLGEELSDTIIGVRNDQAIVNTMFDNSLPELIALPVEVLYEILIQINKYQTEILG